MNFYPHHIGDFIRDTARLNDAQCMAYLRMIWMYYETELPLDDDFDALAFKIGAKVSDVHQILRHFFFLHDGKWHNSRCDKVILEFRAKSTKAKKSANTRWDNAKAMHAYNRSIANAPDIDANQDPKASTQDNQKLLPSVGTDDPCPHQKIIDLYHDLLPVLPRIREWTPARQTLLRNRWKEKPERQSLNWWRDFFGYVAQSDFLCGRVDSRNGKQSFQADLEWLVRPSNLVKVIEGKYENAGGPT